MACVRVRKIRTAHSHTSTRTSAEGPDDTLAPFVDTSSTIAKKVETPEARPEPNHEGFKIGPGSTHIGLVGYTVSINAIHCPVGLGPAGQFAFRASFQAEASKESCGSHAVTPRCSSHRSTANHVPCVKDPFSPEIIKPYEASPRRQAALVSPSVFSSGGRFLVAGKHLCASSELRQPEIRNPQGCRQDS